MDVTFDPKKDAENVERHGTSLGRAEDCNFDAALFDRDDSQDFGKVRWNAIGWLDGRIHSLPLLRMESASERSAFARRHDRRLNFMQASSKTQPDSENPEWTKEKFTRARRFAELPDGLQKALKRRTRGPQKAPTKQLVSLRLSPDVLTALRAKGSGWQTLVDETLRRNFLEKS
jgi:uncharacterized protein (DUF4415 family)/uncharacterized DUF497 family protein